MSKRPPRKDWPYHNWALQKATPAGDTYRCEWCEEQASVFPEDLPPIDPCPGGSRQHEADC